MSAFVRAVGLQLQPAGVVAVAARPSAGPVAGRRLALPRGQRSAALASSSSSSSSSSGSRRKGQSGRGKDSGSARCQAFRRGKHAELAVYAQPLQRSGTLPAWFEPCVREVVSALPRAPLLATVQDVPTLLGGSRTRFVTHAVPESMAADPASWAGMPEVRGLDTKSVLYVREVSSREACPLLGGPCATHKPPAEVEEEPLDEGSVGHCCEEEKSAGAGRAAAGLLPTVTRYWGLVMQSRANGPNGCYLLKTQQTIGCDCSCTHFSLSRVKQGLPLAEQLINAWNTA